LPNSSLLAEGLSRTVAPARARAPLGGSTAHRSSQISMPNTASGRLVAQKSRSAPNGTVSPARDTLVVVAKDVEQLQQALRHCEGNLTGCIYSAKDGRDDASYDVLAPVLRRRVGRLLNDKMPTGVAVSPAMNHGGPFPATGHPHFTAVGLPAAMRRFTRLACYDNVRPQRLPEILRTRNAE